MTRTHWQAISPLLDELLDADAPHRAARLDEIRQHDGALADEIDKLLAQEAALETAHFLDGTALACLGMDASGSTIGGYTLERPIGSGGMGSVWLARRSDGRFAGQAAIKFLNLALLARGGAARFQHEGTALARLTHPNIARLLDAGLAGSQPYLVLEYIDGQPIDAWCDGQSLGVRARLRLFLEVAAAVSHAHNHLILHRDLKPSNILVNAAGEVKLLDFGIAKLLSEESETAPAGALTQFDGRPFTPEYAAPEQVQGGEATIRTDVYALGVLLYMLLTGSHPTSRAEAPAHERLRAILEQDPVPLAQAVRNITSGTAAARASTAPRLARQLRGDLQRIVAKALHKDPARRYATVAEFADDVNRHLRHEPVRARGDAFFYRAGRFLRRHRFAVGAAAAVAIALIAGAAATLWQAVEARRERDEALFQAQMANARADIVNMIQGAVGESGRPLTQREILDRSVDVVARRFGDRPRVAVGLLLPIAGQFFTLGDSEKDFAIMRRAAGIAAASGDSQLVADVACNTVATELRRGHPDEAASQLRRGLDAQARVARPKFSTVIECLRAEADLAQERGDFDLARVKLETAVARLETDRDLGGNLFPSVVSDLASVDTMRDDLPGALAAIKKEQHYHERFGLTDSAEYLGSLRQEAAILAGWGEYRQARAILLAVDARWRGSTAGSATPAWLDQSVGVALLRFGDAAAAAERLHIASEKSRQLGDTARAAATSLSRAQALIALGRLDEAETALRAAQQGNVPNDAFRLLGPATVQAALEAARGKTRDAAAGIDAELARLRAAPRSSRALLAALKVAASVYLEADVARARQYARDAVALAERIARTPGQSADVGEALLLLARAEQRANERDRARQTAQRAAECLANGYAADHPLARAARALAAG